jgi:hypothetical protein
MKCDDGRAALLISLILSIQYNTTSSSPILSSSLWFIVFSLIPCYISFVRLSYNEQNPAFSILQLRQPDASPLNNMAGYTHSGIGRTMSVRFMSHQVVEYKA